MSADQQSVMDDGKEAIQGIEPEGTGRNIEGTGCDAHFVHDRGPHAAQHILQHEEIAVDTDGGFPDVWTGCGIGAEIGIALVVHLFREERDERQTLQILKAGVSGQAVVVVPARNEQRAGDE